MSYTLWAPLLEPDPDPEPLELNNTAMAAGVGNGGSGVRTNDAALLLIGKKVASGGLGSTGTGATTPWSAFGTVVLLEP